jgi:hypothetical protein
MSCAIAFFCILTRVFVENSGSTVVQIRILNLAMIHFGSSEVVPGQYQHKLLNLLKFFASPV